MKMLTKISDKNIQDEQEIAKMMINNIEQKKSTIFNAGAGSGKTYALVECLKYVVSRYGNLLKNQNQQVICITYTNVASEEIVQRLGNSSLVCVSTIHERIWEFINEYQKELVEIHSNNLKSQLEEIYGQFERKNEFVKYRNLTEHEKNEFFECIKNNKSIYYKNYNFGAADFRESMQPILGKFDFLLTNVSQFKKIVDTLIRIDNYETCINNISEKVKGFDEVSYKAIFNRDQLHKMRISHDTLLEYGYQMIDKYDLLKRVIIDKYPYIFLDEYQDTNNKVIDIMSMLQKYSNEVKHDIFVGYFGDSFQNIYNDGVGNRVELIHSGLNEVFKKFNRRSTQEIIKVANKIRNDGGEQISIYEDSEGGRIEFYSGYENQIETFISESSKLFNSTIEEPLHCFMITNKSVAQYSGFENLYRIISDSQYYKINYMQLNTELLSDEVGKLGEIPILLYRIVNFISDLESDDTCVADVLPSTVYTKTNLHELKVIIEILKKISGTTLYENIRMICETYALTEITKCKKAIEDVIGIEDITENGIRSFIIQRLYPNLNEETELEAQENVEKLLQLNICEYKKWYQYIKQNIKSSILYHTYHGTKGLEFDNVVIIMGNSFGKTRDYFSHYFRFYGQQNDFDANDLEKFERARNLLYVSVTRAIKNLRILFIDEIGENEAQIKQIFGDIIPYHVVTD